jgi:carbon-monoxide dehydrogenase medium subunit
LLSVHPGAKVLAGGQTLVSLMKQRAVSPAVVVDISRLDGLAYIRAEDGILHIGALTTDAELEASEVLKASCPVIAQVAADLGDPLVRGASTIGGNLAASDPASDHAATLLALGAEIVARGPGGTRVMPLAEFFVDTAITRLKPDEILTEVRVPILRANSGAAYEKLARRTGDRTTVGVAASLSLRNRVAETVRIGLAGAAAIATRATAAEDYLRGKPVNDETLAETARLASLVSQPASDVRGPAEYKVDLVRVLAERALRRAAARARGQGS